MKQKFRAVCLRHGLLVFTLFFVFKSLPVSGQVDCNNAMVQNDHVLNEVDSELINLLQGGTDYGNIVNSDLESFAQIDLQAAAAGVSLARVKKVEGTYPSGRRVGFVIETVGGLLSTDLAESLTLRTRLDGDIQESITFSGSSGLLGIGLLAGDDPKRRLTLETTEEFDEVELVLSSTVSVSLDGFRIYYAFEEDPSCDADCQTPIILDNFPNVTAECNSTFLLSSCSNASNVISNDLDANGTMSILLIGGEPSIRVNINETQPAGSEVGFVVENPSLLGLLDLDLLDNITLETLDSGGDVEESFNAGGLLNVGLLPGTTDRIVVSFPTTEEYSQVRIQMGGVLETLFVYYAFIRYDDDGDGVPNCIDKCDGGDDNILNLAGEPLDCNPECELDPGYDILVCALGSDGTAQLPPAGAGQNWAAESGNPSPASINNSGEISGLDELGVYEFTLSDTICEFTIEVNYTFGDLDAECNNPLVGNDVAIGNPSNCQLCNDPDAENVISTNLDEFVSYSSLLNIGVGAIPLISVVDTVNVHEAGAQAGFVVSLEGLLNVGVVGNFSLQTRLDGSVQETVGLTVANAQVLPGMAGQQRLFFTTSMDFNEIVLIYEGINVSAIDVIHVFYAFTEPEGCTTESGLEGLCLDPLIASSDFRASINYERTGFTGAVCALCNMSNLSALVDEDFDSGAEIDLDVGVLVSAGLSVKLQRVIEAGNQAGFVVQGSDDLLDVGVLGDIELETYLDGVLQESVVASDGAVGVVLVGGATERAVLAMPTEEDFDELRLVINSPVAANVLTSGFTVYYGFVRGDADGDGVPDCIDKCCAGPDNEDSIGDGIPDACDLPSVAVNDTVQMDFSPTGQDSIVIDVLANDTIGPLGIDDAGIQIVSSPNNGMANVNDNDTPEDPLDDLLVYYPDSCFTGFDTVIYRICNIIGTCTEAIVEIDVRPAARPSLTISGVDECIGDSDTYEVEFLSNGSHILTSSGQVDGNRVIDIPTDESLQLIASNSLECEFDTEASIEAPDSCQVECNYPSVWVGNGVCDELDGLTYTFPYSVYSEDVSVDVSTGVLNGDSTASADVGEDVIITFSSGQCSTSITVQSPEDCLDICNTPQFSATGPVCSGVDEFTYEVRYVEVSGLAVNADFGNNDPSSGLVTDIPIDEDVTLSVLGEVCSSEELTIGGPDRCPGSFDLMVLLQGALINEDDTLMRDDLRQEGLLPNGDPYTISENVRFSNFGSGGRVFAGTDVFTENSGTPQAIVDWIFVELRDENDHSNILETRAALVTREGKIVEARDGESSLAIPVHPNESYFISVKHRNHLGIMTANPIAVNSGDVSIDFREIDPSDLYFDPAIPGFEGFQQAPDILFNGKYALWGGDANSDGQLLLGGTDGDNVFINEFVEDVNPSVDKEGKLTFIPPVIYDSRDLNMDGKVLSSGEKNDIRILLFNIINLSDEIESAPDLNWPDFTEQIPD